MFLVSLSFAMAQVGQSDMSASGAPRLGFVTR